MQLMKMLTLTIVLFATASALAGGSGGGGVLTFAGSSDDLGMDDLEIDFSGAIVSCDQVFSDGVLQKQARAYIDPEKVLLRVSSPSSELPVLTKESVYPYDAPAIWYDRFKECSTLSSKKVDGTLVVKFDCKSPEGLNTVATFELSGDLKTAKYFGVILIPGQPKPFSAEFRACR